jgi:ATP-dependent RNA helicase RhlE
VLDKPHVVELADSAPADLIDHALHPVEENRKRDLLDHILGSQDFGSAIVFTRTKHRAKRLAHQLSRSGHRAVGLQGNMSQGQRDKAMNGFRARRFDILVATDIAARGIDVSNVTHVINYDVPNTPHAYTHRIGRTGRSEESGIARTFVTSSDHSWIRDTERMIGEAIARERVDGFGEDFREERARSKRSNSGSRRPRMSNGRRNRNRSRAGYRS